MHLDDIGQVHDVDLIRNFFSACAVRHPATVPAFEYKRQRLPDLPVQSHPIGENPGRTAVRINQLRDPVTCGESEGSCADAALPARQSPPHMTEHQTQEGQPGHVHRVGVRPEGDVIAEESRKFMGIGVTTDPTHQICVVHNCPLLGVEAHQLSDACRNQ
jgi:hypothetical protein